MAIDSQCRSHARSAPNPGARACGQTSAPPRRTPEGALSSRLPKRRQTGSLAGPLLSAQSTFWERSLRSPAESHEQVVGKRAGGCFEE